MAELDVSLMVLGRWLEQKRIPYMVIGGFAVTVWGEPRFTRDIDVSIQVRPEELEAVVDLLCTEFRSLTADPLRFVKETRVLPVLVGPTPADIIFAALPYEEEAIGRAKRISLGSGDIQVCTPEDLILHKIVSPRPRDHEDVEGVFRYRHAELDYAYLDPRVEELAGALDDETMLRSYRALRQRWKSTS